MFSVKTTVIARAIGGVTDGGRLACQDAHQTDERGEEAGDGEAIKHPELDVFAGANGYDAAQETASFFDVFFEFLHR